MFTWVLKFYLKGGQIVEGLYTSLASGSAEVRKEIMPSYTPAGMWFIFLSLDKKKELDVRLADVSCFEIGAANDVKVD